jgi:hypothetical protein
VTDIRSERPARSPPTAPRSFDKVTQRSEAPVVAEQLKIPGLWERGGPQEPEPPAAPRPPPPEPPQRELLGGSHLLRFKIEEACLALDPPAVRVAHANLVAQSPAQKWGDWADDIAWLIEPASGEALAMRALALNTPADAHLQGAPRFLREKVRSAALRRALQQLTAEALPALADGRPLGFLALEAGDFVLARTLLTAACEASGNALWLGYLGEANWRVGERFAAMQCWCRASLINPSAIDQQWMTGEPVIELIDLHDELELSELPLSYLAVLADLLGKHALDDFALEMPGDASTPRRLASLLRAYRRARASGSLDDAGRIEAKRAMARLAPVGLRELIRPL